MVKLLKNALCRILYDTRRLPFLIELQRFASYLFAFSMVALVLHLSNQPNDFSPVTPSSFLGQNLAPNTPVDSFHDKGDFRKDFIYNATWLH